MQICMFTIELTAVVGTCCSDHNIVFTKYSIKVKFFVYKILFCCIADNDVAAISLSTLQVTISVLNYIPLTIIFD